MSSHNLLSLIETSFVYKTNKGQKTIKWLFPIKCCDIYWISRDLKEKPMDEKVEEEIKKIRQKENKNKWAKSVIDLGTIINKPT